MSVQEKENKVIFFEPPRKFTGLDILLIFYGLAGACVCAYWVYTPFDGIPYGTFIFLALLHLLFAINQIYSYFAATYTLVFDYRLRKVIIDKKSYFGNSDKAYDFAQIRRFYIAQDFDPDNPTGWNVEMELKTGENVVLPHTFDRDEKTFAEIVQTANRYLTNENQPNRK